MSGTEWWVVEDTEEFAPGVVQRVYVGRAALDADLGWVPFEYAYTFASAAAAMETAERFGGFPRRIVR